MVKKNQIIYLIAAGIALVVMIYSFTGESQEAFNQSIIEHRKEIDYFMKNSRESPFSKNREEYKGLTYYEPDISYKVRATFAPIQDKKLVNLSTSDGKIERYRKYGMATFEMHGKENTLIILKPAISGPMGETLFLGFGDETSAVETYGGGRYLNPEHDGGSTILLDFNKAYNPYCAYNEEYSCAIPLTDNLLSIPIYAGEKDFHH
ncbi:MAG: DUF1684 domain-containing protein [Cyclobacteriaceae bacterium]|nr:DUF1684 domain-containing protein [Cyclobacteriaceae bacterium]